MSSSDNRFECKLCGHCCTGNGGIVISSVDIGRLSSFFNCDSEYFINKYCEISNEKIKIKSKDNSCIFFENKKGCIVHQFKPSVCIAWPYFRGNLIDEESFIFAKEYCPGMPQDQTHKDFVAEGLDFLHNNCKTAIEETNSFALKILDIEVNFKND